MRECHDRNQETFPMSQTPAYPMQGHASAQERFMAALASGRLHHGWIVEGPSGIGKSLFVRRLAAHILGAASPDAGLGDPVMQKVAARSHPDLKWVTLELNEKGQLRKDISVDQVRGLNHFFSLRPGLSGWRVGVIDAIDQSNRSGMNALLKTLEEPPDRSILFLINHGSIQILPTLKSRCQTLRLSRLDDDQTSAILAAHEALDPMLVKASMGRPGYGLDILEKGGLDAIRSAQALLQSLRQPKSQTAAVALAAAGQSEAALSIFTDMVLGWVALQAETDPRYGKVWLDLHEVRAVSKELALTPIQAATKLYSVLQLGLKSNEEVS